MDLIKLYLRLFLSNLLLSVMLFIGPSTGSEEVIDITYTLENNLTADDVFSASLSFSTSQKAFIEIMDEAAAIDDIYRYTSTVFQGLGHYIESINGIYANVSSETFWALLNRNGSGQDCVLQVGVSTYQPHDGDHVVFQFAHWDILNILPDCPPPPAVSNSISSLSSDESSNEEKRKKKNLKLKKVVKSSKRKDN